MSTTCKCCAKRSESHLCVSCCVCQNTFNHACVGLSASDTRIIKAKKSVMWTCTNCEKMGSDMSSLKAVIISLQEEVKELKQMHSNNNFDSGKNSQFFEEIIQEINERNNRKRNLIIFGVDEQPSDLSKDDRYGAEKDTVIEILKTASPNFSTSNQVHLQRLGRFDSQNERPRPLRVTLAEEKFVHEFIKQSKKLKNYQSYKNISLAFDKTPRQLDYYRNIKKQLEDRKSKGEDNLRIKYVNGLPKIIQNLN